jgi:hypothetical protein
MNNKRKMKKKIIKKKNKKKIKRVLTCSHAGYFPWNCIWKVVLGECPELPPLSLAGLLKILQEL